jgi:hypothetical protein
MLARPGDERRRHMDMLARAQCTQCGEVGRFDVGADVTTVEDAQRALDEAKLESCPFGHHIELAAIRYVVLSLEDGQALTLDEWKAAMVAKGYDTWTTEELRATEIRIESFAFGMPMAKLRGEDFWLDFVTAPNGDRYYYSPRGAYAEAIAEAAEPATQPTQ